MNFSGKFGSASTIWYPASGCRNFLDGGLINVGGYGSYWPASPTSDYGYGAYFLSLNYDGNVKLSGDDYVIFLASGLSVRCLQVIDEVAEL